VKKLVLAAISFYQHRMSPGMAPACRFQPTCSQYAYEAVERYGTARGIAKALWRLLRCNPLNDGGLDPVEDDHPSLPAPPSPLDSPSLPGIRASRRDEALASSSPYSDVGDRPPLGSPSFPGKGPSKTRRDQGVRSRT
jgi:putative membrane protein insertion efficiency factor